MLRKLLTLLALLSGLTLATQPVSAMDARSVSVAAAALGEDCKPIVSGPLQLMAQDRPPPQSDPKPCKKPAIVYLPPVMLQVDRARE